MAVRKTAALGTFIIATITGCVIGVMVLWMRW
jgi:hypothetical protein